LVLGLEVCGLEKPEKLEGRKCGWSRRNKQQMSGRCDLRGKKG
jgi:hypothetical protein